MTKSYVPLIQAEEFAGELIIALRDSCERIQIAGSIRRQRSMIGDIEIIAIPKVRYVTDLFGHRTPDGYHINATISQFVNKGTRIIKNGDRFKQLILSNGMQLDLFLVLPPAQWGVILALRTGPERFSKFIATTYEKHGSLPPGCVMNKGGIYRNGELIPMPNEENFLSLLGFPGLTPIQRNDVKCQNPK